MILIIDPDDTLLSLTGAAKGVLGVEAIVIVVDLDVVKYPPELKTLILNLIDLPTGEAGKSVTTN